MSLSKKQKVWVYTAVAVVAVLVVVIIINLVISYVIETKIKSSLTTKERNNYTIELRKVNANILTGNINLKDLSITPDSAFIQQLKNGESDQSTAVYAMIPTFRLAGIGIYKALTSKNIDIRKILFKKATLKIYLGKKPDKHPEKAENKMNPDSIFIKGLEGIEIGSIELTKCKLEVIDLVDDIQIVQSEDLELEIEGIQLTELEGQNNYFTIDVDHVIIELLNERINLPDGNYYMTFNRLYLNLSDSLVEIDGFTFKPTYEDKYELARKLKYTSEIFDVTLKKLSVLGIDFQKIKNEGLFYTDSILVQGLDLNILMDKRLPFNTDKRPKLPNESLKRLNIPVYIKGISITGSRLNYQERMPNTTELMTAILGDLDVQVSFATSVEDSIATGKSMVVKLKSNFMDLTPLRADFDFPLISRVDTFYYTGHLSRAQMNEFNQAAYPAMGIKFIQGQLDNINFSGSASPRFSKGEMTMLYHDLEAEVSKKDLLNTNKFLSWVANAVLYTSNPGKNTDIRVVQMEFERVPYKGFGNVVWKTLQSGIVNTVLPTGKTINEEEDQESKKEKRKKRKERK
ncbi:MAG: hypothetical protein KQH67_04520 [Bacteroidetes bacterium]|nr:hypothetical protein [Bacteroidota bacterium]